MTVRPKILVVDDEFSVRWAFEKALTKAGYEVALAENGVKGLALFESFDPDLVLLDIRMPEMEGLQVLKEIRQRKPDTQVIVMTAYSDMETTVNAMKLGAYDFLSKPFNIDDCLMLIAKGLSAKKAAENVQQQSSNVSTGGLIKGNSPAMQEVYKLIGRVSAEDITVLITGESGSGKELVAQAIHYNSNRASKPFWAINCTAIPSSLMEAELFGFEKGAFTGAVSSKPGVFELAQGGTLLLDEIGDMSLEMQAQLLRVLEEKQIVRVGGKTRIKIDVRIIASTNKDLRKAIQEGKFREDLYHRIKVIEISLPPLRKRKEDIPILVNHFTQQYALQKKSIPKIWSEKAINCLLAYHWPGNVRELKNLVEQVCTLTRDQIILPEHIPSEIRNFKSFCVNLVQQDQKSLIKEASNNNSTLQKEVYVRSIENNIDQSSNIFIKSQSVENTNKEVVSQISQSSDALILQFVKNELQTAVSGQVYETIINKVEKILIQQALNMFKGNQVQTANYLGITRNTLRAKIDKYEL